MAKIFPRIPNTETTFPVTVRDQNQKTCHSGVPVETLLDTLVGEVIFPPLHSGTTILQHPHNDTDYINLKFSHNWLPSCHIHRLYTRYFPILLSTNYQYCCINWSLSRKMFTPWYSFLLVLFSLIINPLNLSLSHDPYLISTSTHPNIFTKLENGKTNHAHHRQLSCHLAKVSREFDHSNSCAVTEQLLRPLYLWVRLTSRLIPWCGLLSVFCSPCNARSAQCCLDHTQLTHNAACPFLLTDSALNLSIAIQLIIILKSVKHSTINQSIIFGFSNQNLITCPIFLNNIFPYLVCAKCIP